MAPPHTHLPAAAAPDNHGKDLLHRVIPQSGTAVDEWALDPTPETSFRRAAEALGCSSTQTKAECVQFLRNEVSASDIFKMQMKLYVSREM